MKTLPLILSLLVMLWAQPLIAGDYTNSIGMKFKTIPAGSFYMGSCKLSEEDQKRNKQMQFMGKNEMIPACPSNAKVDTYADDDETPQHEVRITKAFQMGQHEVTLGQFKQFIAGADRYDLLTDAFMNSNRNGDQAAVCHVSWNDARDFIKWLNKKEGKGKYRLPTEAEWEYAARAGTTTIYSWGNDPKEAEKYAWFDTHGRSRNKYANPVGQKLPNPWGLYDMHGNVWEWVNDWYGSSYYRQSPKKDPQGPRAGRRYRSSRGGCWKYYAWDLRTADRTYNPPDYRDGRLGFRVVREE